MLRRGEKDGVCDTAPLPLSPVCGHIRWLVITVLLVREYLAKGSHRALYYSIEKPLKLFQTGAVLEACFSYETPLALRRRGSDHAPHGPAVTSVSSVFK
ncbi:very-long-chain (3R)-3-hydroxyacyl-CoA dehydratase 2 [Arapaima gigas]